VVDFTWELSDNRLNTRVCPGFGKRCYGLRTDFRNCGDFDGLPINLKVLFWVEKSGGRLFRRIPDIQFSGQDGDDHEPFSI
jgi:hypothetical protein